MKINTLTPAEEQLMQVLWTLQTPFMKDIMEALPEPKPHQNTVSTYLKILTEKEFLSPVKVGRIFQYHIAISAEDFRKKTLKDLISKYFENSPSCLIQMMIKEKLLTPEEAIQSLKISSDTPLVSVKTPISEPSDIAKFIEKIIQPKTKKEKKKNKKKKKKK
ncbi:BlaI/MecI/CopY family transcriptional regulator [Bergeyella sp. RCAD1439]|uniref:BlaI/MecI/CopY family transcriptional regulator n=1 Tax=Bergeyella anatis TaxID=3113737 RepID=UPI002E173786|nr:BlaI/MecI/CopY family transcriptional regulator [Bergeyella sp. RCAD1439]